jgi:hypothetical protein
MGNHYTKQGKRMGYTRINIAGITNSLYGRGKYPSTDAFQRPKRYDKYRVPAVFRHIGGKNALYQRPLF